MTSKQLESVNTRLDRELWTDDIMAGIDPETRRVLIYLPTAVIDEIHPILPFKPGSSDGWYYIEHIHKRFEVFIDPTLATQGE